MAVRRVVLRLAAAVLAAAALIVVPTTPAGSNAYGYNLIVPNLIGPRYVQHLYLDPYAYGHSTLAYLLPGAAAQLHNVGFAITYTTTPPTLAGRVWIVSYQDAACGYPYLAWTTNAYGWIASTSHWFIAYSRILICPRAFSYGPSFVNALVKHELGHAQGLHHYDYVYGGVYQLMHAGMTGTRDYQYGDLHGLSYLAYYAAYQRRGGL